MTTYTTFVPGSGTGSTSGTPGAGTTGHPSTYAKKPYVIEAIIDFSVQNAVDTDVFNCFNMPTGSLALAGGAEVITANTTGTGVTVDVGFTGAATAWVSGVAPTSTGYLTMAGDGATAPKPKFSPAGTIKVILTMHATGTVSDGKIRVWTMFVDAAAARTAVT